MAKKQKSSNKKNKQILTIVALIIIVALAIVIVQLQKTDKEVLSKYNTYDAIPARDFYRLVEEAKENKNLIIIDVRTPQEFAQGHIEGAININLYDSNFEQQISQLDKNKTYLLYCRSGHRSGIAKQIFARAGFEKVYDLQGGIISWNQNSLPLVS